MFKKLKQCKTIKEIYEVLGLKPFEIVAFILLVLWTLLPIFATFDQIGIGNNDEYILGKQLLIVDGYQRNVESLGLLTLEFAIVFLIGRIIHYKGQIWQKIKSESWHFLLLVMLLWSCVCTVLSDDPYTSFFGTEYRFDGLEMYFFYAAVYVCAIVVFNSNYRRIVLLAFSMVANVVSILVILQDRGIEILEKCFLNPRAAMFFQFNHTGYYMCMGIACVMGLYVYEKNRIWQIIHILGMILQVYAILVNSTLGSFIGACGALIMIIIFNLRKQGRFQGKLLVPIMVTIVISVASYVGLVPTSSGEDMKVNVETLLSDAKNLAEEGSDAKSIGHGRMTLWQQGLKMIAKRPIFGYGPEQLDEELSEIMWLDRVDNEIIQHGVFLGIPGMLLYLSALISLFIHQWIHMKSLDVWTLITAGCVVAYLVSSLFGNSMFYTTPYFYMFLAMASGRAKISS